MVVDRSWRARQMPIPLSLEIRQELVLISKERSVGHKALPAWGRIKPTLFSHEDSMKKTVSSTRVTPARRKPPARAAARLPAPRFQSRDRRQDEVMTGDVGMLRMPALRRQYPRSRSTIYGDIRAGRFTPPVALGPRCSAWPAREVDQILAARAAGASDRQIRQLVTRLVAERSTCR